MTRIPTLGPRGEGWVAVQVALLVLVAVLGACLSLPPMPQAGGLVVIGFGVLLMSLGAWMVIRGVQSLGRSRTAMPFPRDDASLVTGAAYRRVRHPIYVGLIGLAVGWACVTLSPLALVAAAMLAVVLDLKARREEAWLTERYPELRDLPGADPSVHPWGVLTARRPPSHYHRPVIAYDSRTCLLVVDVQNDFADPAGSLSVRGGDALIPRLNEEIRAALEAGAPVIYTQDWHPPSTPHFAKDGGIWPVHCVGGTWGSELHPDLLVAGPSLRKGRGWRGRLLRLLGARPDFGRDAPDRAGAHASRARESSGS